MCINLNAELILITYHRVIRIRGSGHDGLKCGSIIWKR